METLSDREREAYSRLYQLRQGKTPIDVYGFNLSDEGIERYRGDDEYIVVQHAVKLYGLGNFT